MAFVKVKKGSIEQTIRVAGGLGTIAVTSALGSGVGGGIGGAIGSLLGGHIGSTYIVAGKKQSFAKQFVWWISVLNAIDLLMQTFIPRGVV